MLSDRPIPPRLAGRSAASALRRSPRPCEKSVFTLVWRCSKVSTWPARTVAMREVAIGWVRPSRGSSQRCHVNRTGLPIAFEILAASMAPSPKSL